MHTAEVDGWLVAAVGGELDLSTAPRARAALHQVVLTNPGADVALDLGGVGFCDSVGLGLLIGLRRRVTSAGGRFAIVEVPGRVAMAVEAAGLGDLLPTGMSRGALP